MVGDGYPLTVRRNIPVPEHLARPLGVSQNPASSMNCIEIIVRTRLTVLRGSQDATRTCPQRTTKLIQRSTNWNFFRCPSINRHTHQRKCSWLVIPRLFSFRRFCRIEHKMAVRRELGQNLNHRRSDNRFRCSMVNLLLEEVEATAAIRLEDHCTAIRSPRVGKVSLVIQG